MAVIVSVRAEQHGRVSAYQLRVCRATYVFADRPRRESRRSLSDVWLSTIHCRLNCISYSVCTLPSLHQPVYIAFLFSVLFTKCRYEYCAVQSFSISATFVRIFWFRVIFMIHVHCEFCSMQIFSECELTFTFPICYRPSVCRLSVCRL